MNTPFLISPGGARIARGTLATSAAIDAKLVTLDDASLRPLRGRVSWYTANAREMCQRWTDIDRPSLPDNPRTRLADRWAAEFQMLTAELEAAEDAWIVYYPRGHASVQTAREAAFAVRSEVVTFLKLLGPFRKALPESAQRRHYGRWTSKAVVDDLTFLMRHVADVGEKNPDLAGEAHQLSDRANKAVNDLITAQDIHSGVGGQPLRARRARLWHLFVPARSEFTRAARFALSHRPERAQHYVARRPRSARAVVRGDGSDAT